MPENEERDREAESGPGDRPDEYGARGTEAGEGANPLGGAATGHELGSAPDAGGFPAEFRADGTPEIRWENGPNDAALHGRVSAAVAPHQWEGSRRRLGRPGLGGIYNTTGRDHMEFAARLRGSVMPGRLYFDVSFSPDWRRDYYRLDVGADELARDEVAAPLARRDFALGRRTAGRHAFRLDWQISSRHRLSLLLRGAPEDAEGALQLPARRVSPAQDGGIPVQPAPHGVEESDPATGGRAVRRMADREYALRYVGELGPDTQVVIEAAEFERKTRETPEPGADRRRYFDIRREQIYNSQSLNHFAPVVSPAQYSFGGLGEFNAGGAERDESAAVALSRRFRAAGAHELKAGLETLDRKAREDTLFSGPRGEAGLGVYLGTVRGLPLADSFIRVRSGTMVEVNCYFVNAGFATPGDACPNPVYNALRGSLNPVSPYTNLHEKSAFLQDEWRAGDVRLTVGVRYMKTTANNPDSYSLRSALTGEILLGSDNLPVCSRDRPDPPGGGSADLADGVARPPNCIAGPGKFIGSGWRFPGEFAPRFGLDWDVAGRGRLRVGLAAGRFYDRLPDELLLHAFSSEFGISGARFDQPDLTRQVGGAVTYGGDYRYIAPGTKLGYRDHLRAGIIGTLAPLWRVQVEFRASRQGRVLADTQATPMEEIANFFYDYYFRTPSHCANCPPDQTSMFPLYPYGNTLARAFSPEILANPGVNTPDGLFPRPVRRERSLTATVERTAAPGGHFSASASGRLARARGNYEGLAEQENGSGETKLTSLFAFPYSPLSRGQYALGPLDPSEPGFLRLRAGCTELGMKGFSAELSYTWIQGTLRTPMLANPFAPYPGLIPGTDPHYDLLQLNNLGYVSRQVLTDYQPAQRGANGRNPGSSRWDLRVHYRRPFIWGALDVSLAIGNLLNTTRVLRYDDALETPAGYTEPVAEAAASLLPPTFLPLPDSTRVANPAYGMPLQVQDPRTIRLGAAWSF